MVATAAGRITPHRALPYEELDLRHKFAHICSQGNQQKLLPPELHSLTPVCTKSFLGWGFAPDATGELTAFLQTSWLSLRGPISNGTGGERGRTGEA